MGRGSNFWIADRETDKRPMGAFLFLEPETPFSPTQEPLGLVACKIIVILKRRDEVEDIGRPQRWAIHDKRSVPIWKVRSTSL
jgi:hypothetical protein